MTDLHDLSWPQRTERLTLRPAVPADSPALFAHRSHPATGRFLGWMPQSQADWDEQYPQKMGTTLVIERDGVFIGDLMLRVEDGWGQREVAESARGTQAELGWTLHPDAAGQGYGTEAVRALIGICFSQLGLRRVTASAFADNEASWRLMERAGMRREALMRAESLHRELGWRDSVLYAVLADEWPA